MKTLKTYATAPPAVTTWNYDASTDWLTSKRDAAGFGPRLYLHGGRPPGDEDLGADGAFEPS